ncbi:MAG: coenzyme F430 synthase [Candidatus Helarchaeota archaeon]
MRQKVIVMDMTHGGPTICYELTKQYEQVYGVDIYKTLNPKESTKLANSGVEILSDLQNIPLDETDIIVAPVHCPLSFLKPALQRKIAILTHHQMVRQLLKNQLQDKFIVEITGVKGKTTTAYLISQLLADSGMKIVTLTSLGLSYWTDAHEIPINPSLNISPGNLLHAVKINKSYDACIFEISLGITGLGNVGIITSLIPDYLIADKSMKSSSAKLQMLSMMQDSSLVLLNSNYKIPDFTPHISAHYVEYGLQGEIRIMDYHLSHLGAEPRVKIKTDFQYSNYHKLTFCLKLKPELFGFAYIEALMAGIGTCLALNYNKGAILKAIEGLQPIKGRLELEKRYDIWIIKDINSGVSISSILYIIEILQPILSSHRGKLWLIVGIHNSNLCETIELPELMRCLQPWLPLIQNISVLPSSTSSYETSLHQALTECQTNDIILLCIKTRG